MPFAVSKFKDWHWLSFIQRFAQTSTVFAGSKLRKLPIRIFPTLSGLGVSGCILVQVFPKVPENKVVSVSSHKGVIHCEHIYRILISNHITKKNDHHCPYLQHLKTFFYSRSIIWCFEKPKPQYWYLCVWGHCIMCARSSTNLRCVAFKTVRLSPLDLFLIYNSWKLCLTYIIRIILILNALCGKTCAMV